jgi:hypothetical protein
MLPTGFPSTYIFISEGIAAIGFTPYYLFNTTAIFIIASFEVITLSLNQT